MYAEKRPNGTFRGRYRDAYGQLRTAGTYATREEALAAAQAAVEADLNNQDDSVGAMPLAHYFYEHWLTHPHVAIATQINYESAFRNHIDPTLGHVPIKDITTRHVRALIKEHLSEGRLHLANKIKATIGSIFSTLVEEEEVTSNPAHGIKIKQPDAKPFVPMMPDEFKKIIEELPNDACRFFATFLVGTGMRFGEAAGIQVNDFIASTNELQVRRRVCRVPKSKSPNGTRFVVKPETKSGYNRIIPLSETLAGNLLHYIEEHDLEGDSVVFRHQDMFPSDKAESLATDFVLWERWNAALHEAIVAAGFEGRGWSTHTLRHANATLLVTSNIDIYEIQQRLGHREMSTTQRYVHRVKAMQSRAAEATDAFIA